MRKSLVFCMELRIKIQELFAIFFVQIKNNRGFIKTR